MRPAFSSTRQAGMFALLLLVLLLLPLAMPKSLLPPRREVYSSLPWGYGGYPYISEQIFDEKGDLLTWFGEPGADNKIQNLPAKVLVDYDDVGCFGSYIAPNFKVENLVMVVNQIGPHKVSVYGFGQKK